MPHLPPASSPIRIAIVDDQKLFRGGLKMILDGTEDIEVVFEAGHGEQFFERLAFEPVQLVILDVEMPGMDGIATLEQLQRERPEIHVIMLTMHDSDRLISHLMGLGASGFLLKDEDPEVVIEAVRRVVQEGLFFRDYVSKALLKGGRSRQKAVGYRGPDISDRELEVLQLICQELTSKEIAAQLFISVRTVEGHRRSLQDKTGAKNIVGLVLFAIRQGLVQ
ncbi:response regulator transcription factor [Neolewinella antarctica]|uniref:DNA-binding NarL/FixJ family response regulator n=1 Tax=Neolewinella antarctica TaxID=442734 RepID=A0ABX0X6S2_9BACT|nr:response regulator transcription factor [Neolewinella antarctica]NJC24915.1 DNA-binding NarL/FixJ family response regulator [Neolewinella antarctica]